MRTPCTDADPQLPHRAQEHPHQRCRYDCSTTPSGRFFVGCFLMGGAAACCDSHTVLLLSPLGQGSLSPSHTHTHAHTRHPQEISHQQQNKHTHTYTCTNSRKTPKPKYALTAICHTCRQLKRRPKLRCCSYWDPQEPPTEQSPYRRPS